jgi:hypothetical protein
MLRFLTATAWRELEQHVAGPKWNMEYWLEPVENFETYVRTV